MTATVWTEDRVTELRILWSRGDSFQVIADHMGITPRAVEAARYKFDLPPRKQGRVKGSKNVKVVPVPAFAGRQIAVLPPSDIPWPSKQQMMIGKAR